MSDQPLIDARPDHLDIVREILRRHVPDRKVLAFGSRVTWTAKTYSDLDLVILGDELLDLRVTASLKEDFSESDLPWKVDVVDWAGTSESFRKIIRKNKVEFPLGEEWRKTKWDEETRKQNTFRFSRSHVMSTLDEEQEDIGLFASSFDRKIDLNLRMNETLEAMARAIFKDWFVDFGPTRAKMEGREPYLAQEIWDQFPDKLDDEGVPEGWDVSTIGKETTVVGGSTPSTKEPLFWGGGINWVTPKDLSALKSLVLFETNRTVTATGLEKISSGLLPTGIVLLSSRAPIGYIAISAIPVAVNQGFIALRCDGRLSNIYVWRWLHENMGAIKGNANGSTFQEISKKNFRPLPVVVPSKEVILEFNNVTMPLLRAHFKKQF